MLSYLRWDDFDRMPDDVRDPYRWLDNANTKQRAKLLGTLDGVQRQFAAVRIRDAHEEVPVLG